MLRFCVESWLILAGSTEPNMLDLLFRQKALNSNSFALCFGHDGGYMTLGGYRSDKHLKGEGIQKVKFSGNYMVSLKSLRVDVSHTDWKGSCA